MTRSVWIGYDPRETDSFAVARRSLLEHANIPVSIHPVVLSGLRTAGLYTRPTEVRDGRLFDVLSQHPMSTEFACSRFLVPLLAREGWALFMDCDVLVRRDIGELFDLADESKAVMVVKHDYAPAALTKMDGQVQSRYNRKNWSSVMLFNVRHPANAALTLDLINTAPGRDLHAFCWLEDGLIGELPPQWNYLVGVTEGVPEPAIVHFTEGTPSMPGHELQPYADEWRDTLFEWLSEGRRDD